MTDDEDKLQLNEMKDPEYKRLERLRKHCKWIILGLFSMGVGGAIFGIGLGLANYLLAAEINPLEVASYGLACGIALLVGYGTYRLVKNKWVIPVAFILGTIFLSLGSFCIWHAKNAKGPVGALIGVIVCGLAYVGLFAFILIGFTEYEMDVIMVEKLEKTKPERKPEKPKKWSELPEDERWDKLQEALDEDCYDE